MAVAQCIRAQAATEYIANQQHQSVCLITARMPQPPAKTIRRPGYAGLNPLVLLTALMRLHLTVVATLSCVFGAAGV